MSFLLQQIFLKQKPTSAIKQIKYFRYPTKEILTNKNLKLLVHHTICLDKHIFKQILTYKYESSHNNNYWIRILYLDPSVKELTSISMS